MKFRIFFIKYRRYTFVDYTTKSLESAQQFADSRRFKKWVSIHEIESCDSCTIFHPRVYREHEKAEWKPLPIGEE